MTRVRNHCHLSRPQPQPCLGSVGWASSAPGQSSHLSHLGLAHARVLAAGQWDGLLCCLRVGQSEGVLNPDMSEAAGPSRRDAAVSLWGTTSRQDVCVCACTCARVGGKWRVSACESDGQERTEVQRVHQSRGWPVCLLPLPVHHWRWRRTSREGGSRDMKPGTRGRTWATEAPEWVTFSPRAELGAGLALRPGAG